MNKFIIAAQNRLANKSAEAYVDSGVKILIAVVIGALLLAGLVWLFNEVIMPAVNTEVTEMFDGTGEEFVAPA